MKIKHCWTLESIDKDELLERITGKYQSNFILIDTLGKYSGNDYRIKGATTIRYLEAIDRRNELLTYDEIIVYCRAKDCPLSEKVAVGLKLFDIPNVKVYKGGIEEWIAFGLPVEGYERD
jgi:rhodanese-related sulfurtransferase